MPCPKFLITHIKNEEYLLRWWLPHHINKFDFGVVIDYGSTDGSLDLVRSIAPHWQILRSRNKNFNAFEADREVLDIEHQLQNQYPRSYMMALTATEFLIGDTSILEHVPYRIQSLIECDMVVDTKQEQGKELDFNQSLFKQRFHGVKAEYDNCKYKIENAQFAKDHVKRCSEDENFRKNGIVGIKAMRSLHNYNVNYFETSMYGNGRHFWGTPSQDFRVLCYVYSPYNQKTMQRRMAIQKEIPQEDLAQGMGSHHIVNEERSDLRLQFYQEHSNSLRDLIEKYEPGTFL